MISRREGGGEGNGKIDEGEEIHTTSYKISPGDVMNSTRNIVNNTMVTLNGMKFKKCNHHALHLKLTF